MNWDQYFMEMAELTARKSKDRSTKVGCVIVGEDDEVRSTGFNGFPRGVNDDVEERHERPAKYKWTEHAERNAIYNAAKVGTPLKGCRIYVTLMSCSDCARAIIQAGIVEVIYSKENTEKYLNVLCEEFDLAREMLEEAGVTIRSM